MFTKGNVAFLSRRTITQHGYQHRVEYVPKKRMYAVLERKPVNAAWNFGLLDGRNEADMRSEGYSAYL